MGHIRGEYWIQDGHVDFADGDVGDQNHEMIALNSIASDYIDEIYDYAQELGIDTENFDMYDENQFATVGELLQAIHYALLEKRIDSVKISEVIINKLNINAEIYKMLGSGGDARLYVMKHKGWIAVRSDNIELFGYDANKKKQLASGLEDILDQEGIYEEIPDDQLEFNLYDHKTNRSSNVTLADIKNTNVFRPQQLPSTTYNRPLFLPKDRSKPMGSMSPKNTDIKLRQLQQTSESFSFKKWIKKDNKSFIIRRIWPQ